MKHIILCHVIFCLFSIYPAWAGNNESAGCALDLDYTTRNYQPDIDVNDIESTVNAQTGEEIYVSIVAQNVTNLDTYQVELTFDPSRLELIQVFEEIPFIEIKNFLKKNQGQTVGFQNVVKSPGLINIANSLVGKDTSEAPEGTGIIAIVKFKVLDDQSNNTIELSNVFYADSNIIKDAITHLSHATINNQTENNQYPVANQDNLNMLANQSINISVLSNDYDPDNDPLTLINLSSPLNGNAVLNADQSITYTPDIDFSGLDLFQYTISDSKGYTAVAQCAIEIYSNTLQLSLSNQVAIENGLARYELKLSNPEHIDIKGLFAKITFAPKIMNVSDVNLVNGLLGNKDYVIQFNSDNDGELILSIYATSPSYISDSGIIANIDFNIIGNCGDIGALSFQMAELNEIPLESIDGIVIVQGRPSITGIDDLTIDEDTSSQSMNFSIDDCESSQLTITTFSNNLTLIPNDNDHIQISGNDQLRNISIHPASNQAGIGTISIMVTDADGLTEMTSFVVNVNPKSDTPIVEIEDSVKTIVNSDISLNIQASLSDSDGSEELSIIIADLPENAILTAGQAEVDGSWLLSPDDLENLQLKLPENYSGSFTLTVTVISTELLNNDQQIITKTIDVLCSGLMLSGKIEYYADNAPVNNVLLALEGIHRYTAISNQEGNYSFVNIIPGDYQLVAQKTDDLKGLSNTDAGYVGLHVINKYSLNCMKKIAADVTQNGSISPLDASNLSIAATPGNGIECLNDQCIHWVFSTDMIDTCDDLSYTNMRQYVALKENKDNQNFYAIRLGDVNGSWEKDR